MLKFSGWYGPADSRGLGAKGREGRRELVKASKVKNDTFGLGIKINSGAQVVVNTKLTSKTKCIKNEYDIEQHRRQSLFRFLS